jgi:[ribosomal protein S5]-alanine N-acetyltransferase
MSIKIETPNLILLACDQQILEYALEGNQQLSRHINTIVPDNWTEFGSRALKYSLDKLKSSKDEKGWWSYLPIHKADNKLIGLCGYKGQPNEKGQVEIGYEIISEYRNKGLATELAKALVENAFNFKTVNSVQAHTLGEINASNKVLSNCGFQKTDEIDGKELGTLWKWELKQ